jgi:hypothetical protein
MLKKIIDNLINEGCLPIIFLKAKYDKTDIEINKNLLIPKSSEYYSTDWLRVQNYYKNISTNIDDVVFETEILNEKKI